MDLVKRALDRNIIRFIISGGTAALVEYAVFVICTLSLALEISNVISFMAGLVVSFLLNKIWVFGVSNNTARQMSYYFILSVVNVTIGTGAILLLVNYIGVWRYVSKIVVMVMIATWNFFIYKKLIFKSTHP